MKTNIRNINQLKAYWQVQRVLYLLMVMSYNKYQRNRETEEDNPCIEDLDVYGVDIAMEPVLPVLIDNIDADGNGYSINNLTVRYTINPADYKAFSAYVALLEDDEIINIIPAEKTGAGTAIFAQGFQFNLNKKYEIQIILNYGTEVEVKSDNVELKVIKIYIEKQDPEFPNVRLRWNDYYPPLGDKTIVIRGTESGGIPLNNKRIKYEIVYPTPEDLSQLSYTASVTLTPSEAVFTNGKAEFQLSAQNLTPRINSDPTTGIDRIVIKFIPLSENNEPQGEIVGIWNVKNNSNTNMQTYHCIRASPANT